MTHLLIKINMSQLRAMIEKINYIITDSIRMSIFSNIKTGNVIYDTFIKTIVLTLMSYIVKYMYESTIDGNFKMENINISANFRYWFYKKNKFILTGKRCSAISWNCSQVISSAFSERFKAVWSEIINNMQRWH